ncbi:MAG: S8 family serine peptidase [Polyangiaceae bacterium]|nr:S8 family serine peptidase [Polyangiaceae bacterium]
MRRRLRWFGLVVLHAAVAGCAGDPEGSPVDVGDVDAAPPGEAVFAPGEVTELWFVELERAPRSRGGDPAKLGEERALFKEASVRFGLRYKERFSFDRLWNGLSIRVPASAVQTLRQMPGVKAVYPVIPIEHDGAQPSGGGSSQDLGTALAMSGADIAQSTLGYTGENIRVGVIDSGIDYDHPDLGGCFGDGCRVAYGHDFVGDAYDARDGSTQPVPDGDPDDCGGHGSHVAGIIGANGVVTGVAPNVTFGAYRVFGCSGSTSSDIMLKAMEMAAADGMRVVNMSIGSPFQWPSYPSAVAASQLVRDGVVVVTSTGNSGASGLWAAGAPGVGEHVIATAAIENTYVAGPAFSVAPGDTLHGYKRATGAPIAPLSGTAPMTRTGTVTSTSDACVALPAGSLAGQVVLIRRGGCTFNIKSANAQAAGAAGVVIYNNAPGTLGLTVASGTPITVPVVGITADDGALINGLMDQGPVTHSWTNQTTSTLNAVGGLLASYSSYGMTAALTLKPDIAAPGGNIWSTYPLELGGYESAGGTSMASPHVAGAVALLLEARPGLPATGVRDVLQNSAVPAVYGGDVAGGVPDHAFRQGAGMVHIDRSILETTTISPGKLSLGESEAGPATRTLTLTNEGAADVTYDLSHVAAKSAGGDHWVPTVPADGYASVQLSAPSVTVPAGGTATVDVTITADAALADNSLYGGYLVFTPQGGTNALRVPYAGYKGDYQAIQVLTPAADGYPWLASLSGSTYTSQPNGATFTLQSGDIPYILVHYDHQASKMTLDAYEATTMKPYGQVTQEVDLGQSSALTGTSARSSYAWNGKVTLNKKTTLVPNGTYVLKLRVLKALGDESNPAHWETWTSPPSTINHP